MDVCISSWYRGRELYFHYLKKIYFVQVLHYSIEKIIISFASVAAAPLLYMAGDLSRNSSRRSRRLGFAGGEEEDIDRASPVQELRC